MKSMTARDDLIQKLEEIDLWPEILQELDSYLANAIYTKDIEMIRLLLKAGANPNPKEDHECYLYDLLCEYQLTKTTNGKFILEIIELLLQSGANVNRVVQSNYRAYDYAVAYKLHDLVPLLEKYGAEKVLRELL